MTWRVLISAPYFQPHVDRFANFFYENNIEVVIPPVDERMSESEILSWIHDIDGVVCGDDQYTAKVLTQAPKLKIISKWGTGIDSIDVKTANEIGILVKNTPNAFSEPVADTVLGYILCFARQIPWLDQNLRSGVWAKTPLFSLSEQSLGVIGVGNVGKSVIRRAKAFGMSILANDIENIPTTFSNEYNIESVSKTDLLSRADFVSLNCDLNPTSHHILSDYEFSLMKTTACLINTARGPLVDEPALVRALKEGKIGGAALDVFEQEPLPKESELFSIKNCILSPHNSNSSYKAWEKVHLNTLNNLIDGLTNKDKMK